LQALVPNLSPLLWETAPQLGSPDVGTGFPTAGKRDASALG